MVIDTQVQAKLETFTIEWFSQASKTSKSLLILNLLSIEILILNFGRISEQQNDNKSWGCNK